MHIVAVILAGGSILAPDGSVHLTALLPIGTRKLYEIGVEALEGLVSKVLMIGDVPTGSYTSVPAGNNPIEHLKNVLDWMEVNNETPDYLLIYPVDQPFVTNNDMRSFLAKVQEVKADWIYSFASIQDCSEAYPRMKRTSFFGFTGGNLILFRVSKLKRCLFDTKGIYLARKNPVLSILLALWFAVKNRLSLKLVRCSPALASDIDKWKHYETVKAILGLS